MSSKSLLRITMEAPIFLQTTSSHKWTTIAMLVTTNHQANLARDVLSESMPVKLTIDATNAITMSATIATEKGEY